MGANNSSESTSAQSGSGSAGSNDAPVENQPAHTMAEIQSLERKILAFGKCPLAVEGVFV